MDTQSTDPLTARDRFASRRIQDGVKLFAIFLGLVVASSVILSVLHAGFLSMLVADAIALGTVYYLYTQWVKRPIKIECNSCDSVILTNTPWHCRACGSRNLDTENYPFVFKCENCGVEPKAYRCHRKNGDHGLCNSMIYLTEDHDETNFAQSINAPADVPVEDEHVQNLKELSNKKATLLAERDVALVEESLSQIQERIRAKRGKKPTTKKVVEAEVDYMMDLEKAEAELISEVEKKYPNNKPMQTRMKRAIKTAIESKKSNRL